MQAAYRRTGDMDGLLIQLFYVSKIETGNMPLSVQKIEIADFIRNYVNGKQELLDKEKEQMAWVSAAKQHRAIAEEIILKELIYV